MEVCKTFCMMLLAVFVFPLGGAHAKEEINMEAVYRGVGCKDLSIEKPFINGRITVSGYIPERGGKKITVSWCKKKEYYLMLIIENGNIEGGACSGVMPWPYPPEDVKLIDVSDDLGEYSYVEDIFEKVTNPSRSVFEIRHGPSGKKASGMAIQEGVGFQNIFYCFDGHWLRNYVD